MEPTRNNSTHATDDLLTVGRSALLPFPNPFVGLRPFRTEESLLFFGRNEQTVELLQQLHKTRFLAVVGSSGCGKSSLIRAGLIPKLKAGFLIEDRDRWLTAAMKPGDSPLRNLAAALLEATFGDTTDAMIDDFVKAVRQSGVETITTRLAAKLGDASSNLLLLVDQFEEIFRFGVESNKPDQREEAEDFVSLMLALAAQRSLPIYVVMTMRSDFIGDCDNFYGLPEAMNSSQYLVPRLTRQQRQQAIEGPIRLFGATLTPRLLDRVLNDVGDKSDQLPVMQHALMRTFEVWKKSEDAEVDLKHYEDESVGTLTQALSKDAEAALSALSEEEQKIAERMFQALTDTDARNRQIRRPAHLSELCAITGASRETLEAIIEEFSGSGRSFLTATKESDPLIDISHESLIRQWRQMSEWVNAETEWRDRYKRLSHDAEIHRQSGKNEDLLKGSQLVSALEWKKKCSPNHAWARRYHSNLEQMESDQLFNLVIAYLNKSDQTSRREVEQAEQRRKDVQEKKIISLLTIFAMLLGLTAFFLHSIEQDEELRSQMYPKDMYIAEEEFDQHNYSLTINLLTKYLPERLNFFEKDLRNERWHKLWRQTHDEFATLKLEGHKELVTSVAFSPDGKTIVTTSFDKTVRLWDAISRQNITNLKGHGDSVYSASFAPDSNTLASASSDKTVKLWDIRSGRSIATLRGHESDVMSVAFAPDGKTIASASKDKTIRLWDAHSGQHLNTFTGHEDYVLSVAFSPDGRTLASASRDSTIKLWDLAGCQTIATLKSHENSVLSVAFSFDGQTIASASSDKTVKLWDVRSGQNIATLKGHKETVWSVAFAPDGKTLASASHDYTVKLWDVRSGRNNATLVGHEFDVMSVAFSPDGKTLASGSWDKTVKLWDVRFRQNIVMLKGHKEPVWSVAFAPDGMTLASASYDKTVKLWDAHSGQLLKTIKGHKDVVWSIAFTPDGKTLASASSDQTIKLWDIRYGQNIATLKGHESDILSVAFAPDGNTLASASYDKTVKLWDARSGQLLNILKGHEDSVWSVAFASDGNTLASASYDKTVKLWDARSGQLLNTLKGHEDFVNSVAFAPDGKTLASGSGDKTVKLWDGRSGQMLNTLKGHEFSLRSVAFAPDGKTLASASNDKTVILWDARSGQLLTTLKGHEDSVRSVVFTPDGKTLASAGGDIDGKKDFSIRLWRAAKDADVERQRNR